MYIYICRHICIHMYTYIHIEGCRPQLTLAPISGTVQVHPERPSGPPRPSPEPDGASGHPGASARPRAAKDTTRAPSR